MDPVIDAVVHVGVVLILVSSRHHVKVQELVIHVLQEAAEVFDEILDLVSGRMRRDVLLCELVYCGIDGFLDLIGGFLVQPVRGLTSVFFGLVALQGDISID